MREGIEEYSKRLKPVVKVDVLESDEEKMPENPSAAVKGKVLEKEGEKLLESVSIPTKLLRSPRLARDVI